MDGWMDEWMNEWMNEWWMGERTNILLNEQTHFCLRAHDSACGTPCADVYAWMDADNCWIGTSTCNFPSWRGLQVVCRTPLKWCTRTQQLIRTLSANQSLCHCFRCLLMHLNHHALKSCRILQVHFNSSCSLARFQLRWVNVPELPSLQQVHRPRLRSAGGISSWLTTLVLSSQCWSLMHESWVQWSCSVWLCWLLPGFASVWPPAADKTLSTFL